MRGSPSLNLIARQIIMAVQFPTGVCVCVCVWGEGGVGCVCVWRMCVCVCVAYVCVWGVCGELV